MNSCCQYDVNLHRVKLDPAVAKPSVNNPNKLSVSDKSPLTTAILSKLQQSDQKVSLLYWVKLYAHLKELKIKPILSLNNTERDSFLNQGYIDANGWLTNTFFKAVSQDSTNKLHNIILKQRWLEGLPVKIAVKYLIKVFDTLKKDNFSKISENQFKSCKDLLRNLPKYTFYLKSLLSDKKLYSKKLNVHYQKLKFKKIKNQVLILGAFKQHAFYIGVEPVSTESFKVTYFDFYESLRLNKTNDIFHEKDLYSPHQFIITGKDNLSVLNKFLELYQHMYKLTNKSTKSSDVLTDNHTILFKQFKSAFKSIFDTGVFNNGLVSTQFVKQFFGVLSEKGFSSQLPFEDVNPLLSAVNFKLENYYNFSDSTYDLLNANVVDYCHSLVIEKLIHEPELFFPNSKRVSFSEGWNKGAFCLQEGDFCTVHNLLGALFGMNNFDSDQRDEFLRVFTECVEKEVSGPDGSFKLVESNKKSAVNYDDFSNCSGRNISLPMGGELSIILKASLF
ncbi:hypothetical protein DID76_00955 [Candidatus Marinamargulisbacteria bacterium SCGC AG-414-C22]|nr:hypothetical protein DID76_00955 [Candidatus Marinamargulisbacteria bacterium SCGC AG-414-C22]